MSWFSKLKNSLNPRRLDEDLSDEMRDHLERRTADLGGKGLSPEEARRQAGLRFGNVTGVRERSREARLWTGLESTLQDLRYALRGMRRSPAFAATAILSLGLAIGANTAIFSIVDAAILRPLPVPEPDRLFTLATPDVDQPGRETSRERETFSYPLYLRFRTAAGGSARLAAFTGTNRTEAQIPDENAPVEMVAQQFVSGEAFEILGVSPALGRLFSSEEDRGPGGHPAVVLSHDYWRRRFHADPNIVGQKVKINGQVYFIIGVTEERFFGVEPGKFVDVWLPVMMFDPGVFTNPDANLFRVIGRLAQSGSREQIQARLQPAFHDHQEDFIRRNPLPSGIQKQVRDMTLKVYSGAAGASEFRRTFAGPLWIVLGVAAGILLIACANVASLLLARSTARSAEMALRMSLGAGKSRVGRQLLTESLLLSGLATGLGLILAQLAAPWLVGQLSKHGDPVRFALATDMRVLMFCAAVCTFAALLFGLVPAWQTAAGPPMFALRHVSGQAGKLRMGRLFVAVQVAFAFCLVVAGSGFLFSLRNLLAVDTGFDPRGVAVLSINSDMGPGQNALQLTRQLQSRVAALPNVQAAAVAWLAIFEGSKRTDRVILPGQPPSEKEEIFYRISPGFFTAMRIPLLDGRDLESRDSDASQPVATVVNRAFARKYFGEARVLGKEFLRVDGVRHQIVGVAANAYYGDLRNGPEPVAYFPMKPPRHFTLYVRSSLDLGSVARIVQRETKEMGMVSRVAEITTLETLVGNSILREKLLAGIGGVFAFLGLMLAAIGLFGLLNYSVVRRTKEIGIRAALGAGPQGLVMLVLKDLFGMIAGGLLVGLAGSLVLMSFVRSLLFGIGPADPMVMATAAAVFLLAAFLTGSLPASRAAAIDPMVALRHD